MSTAPGATVVELGGSTVIDHISLGVRDLARSRALYEAMLGALGHGVKLVHEHTVGFGKSYPELWLNARPQRTPSRDSGDHVCLRAKSEEAVRAFYEAALAAGAHDAGPPGPRPEYHAQYYAAFVRDFDGHVLEAVTFTPV